ncbi:MAG: IS1634 family transposase [Candidatus Auribacterota bacterium]|nr:IS1634 family transposase [Candidatus Auribacterota bacterium]
MFVRKKQNKTGSVSIQIIDKSNGYKVVKTIGCSKNQNTIRQLVKKAQQTIRTCDGKQSELFSFRDKDTTIIENFLNDLSNAQIHTVGPELIFGTLFNRIGFNVIKEELFRHIVITRLVFPASKLKTVDYLYRYQGKTIKSDAVYRFLDKLCDNYKDVVEKVSFKYTERTLKNISVVFYDMTTLYFEAEDEDDLRKIGFSKDGKFQKPQIMLGLLVGQHGYPIGYDIFEGNTFEGHTLLPILEKIQKKYNFSNPVVVADAALLSKKNIENLSHKKYPFIIGARIKNESDEVKREILKLANGIKDGENFVITKTDGTRLVVTHSNKRQKKDLYNREKGLVKLRQKIKSGRLTKESINNRGYNKFLILDGKIKVEIDKNKIRSDGLWDGLKGYITNTQLSAKNIVENYHHLWQIEKAFRISKTDLRIRPIHHYKRKRIEAHICIAFVAYTIYKELERLLYKYGAEFSVARATELTHNMYEIEFQPPDSIESRKIMLKLDKQQQALYNFVCG